ncbi:hypothetical protein F4776DRAFT_501242 [Hypoxylon sp. NC0597]|nr:hypothetical protein F4776DRAFT_501242 [Hypoxylon sp. NC0597]
MAGIRFAMPDSNVDLSPKVKNDPFAKLPREVIFKICHLLFDENVPELAKASWVVHALTRNDGGFWKLSLQYNLGWFFEAQELIRLGALRRPEMFKGIYLWATKKIWVHLWLDGPLMHVANRRRIWVTCEELANAYGARRY